MRGLMRRPLRALLPALCAVAIAPGVAAQTFPSKPVRIVVGFAPGGAADTLARATAAKLAELMGQPAIVDNRPGAGGLIAADHVAKASADGHTLLLSGINHYLMPFFQKGQPYDAVKDFVPVVVLVNLSNVLAVNPGVPVNSVKELVDYAKKNPGKLAYGTVGVGSLQHLGGVLLAHTAGIEIEHVPYKGGSPTINDVLGGSLPMAILSATTVMPYARTGKLRALGVIHAQRSRSFPDVPMIGETVAGYATPDQWLGILGQSAIPSPVVARLNGEFRRALADPEVAKRVEGLGFEVAGNTPEETAARVRSEYEVIRRAVTAAGIKQE
jgi:tripartite-type tricarboxylate transporter receptor subunit TctC